MKHAESMNDHGSPAQKEYSRLAREYDETWSFYIQATLRETMKRIEVYPGQRLLDVGCGTGILLEALEKKHPDVSLAGIDPTREMLDIAGKRVSKKVRLTRGRAESLPFEPETFDIMVSCSMFHYIREPIIALEEAMRVLKPGGRLVITDWCGDYVTCRICDLFLRVFNKAHLKTYGARECGCFLSSSGFSEIGIDRYKINWLWGMMTATARKGLGNCRKM